MQQKILKYGLISGSIIVLIPLISGLIMGTDPETYQMGEIIGYSTMIISLLLIFFAVNEYKQANPDVEISFGKVFLIGLGISVIAGFFFGVYNWVYVTYIAPDFMDQYFGYYIENIRNSGASQQQIESQIAKLESEKEFFMNPFISSFVMFVTVFGIGLIISIVSAFSQKSKNNLNEA